MEIRPIDSADSRNRFGGAFTHLIRRRANLHPRPQHRMADTANSAAWQDPGVRPAFSAGVGRALVPGRGASGTRPRRLRNRIP
jgi:hypothetical protein